MKTRSHRPLLVLNGVLLTAVLTLAIAPRVGAESTQPRARGQYTMVSGKIQGGGNDTVYIIDSANQEIVALTWDIAKSDLSVIGLRNLVGDAREQRGTR